MVLNYTPIPQNMLMSRVPQKKNFAPPSATSTEVALQQSLASNLRNQSPADVRGRITHAPNTSTPSGPTYSPAPGDEFSDEYWRSQGFLGRQDALDKGAMDGGGGGDVLGADTVNVPDKQGELKGTRIEKDGLVLEKLGEPGSDEFKVVDTIEAMRQREQEATQNQIDAQTGIFNQMKENVLGQIPQLEQARDLRLQGLGQGLEQFQNTAQQQQQQLTGGLEEKKAGIEEEFTRAGRRTRASARALARQLRNRFAGAGSLDSTQYRDYNIEQSKSVAQALGDINRQKAGDISSIGREEEDLKQYFANQVLAEQKRVQLAKELERNQTDQLINQVRGDANLTDAQKVSSIVDAQNKLATRENELDTMLVDIQERRRQEERDLALKLMDLRQKSAGSTTSPEKLKAMADDRIAMLISQARDIYGEDVTSSQIANYVLSTADKDTLETSGVAGALKPLADQGKQSFIPTNPLATLGMINPLLGSRLGQGIQQQQNPILNQSVANQGGSIRDQTLSSSFFQ